MGGSLRFNSRTLGRVRLPLVPQLLVGYKVSIHAPWEGCDKIANAKPFTLWVSIHAPWEGCDTDVQMYHCMRIKFQFTHPGKGAT